MSLYHALFGENPIAEILLVAVGLTRHQIPRYRDVFLVKRENGEMQICIHTRTGGGNRAYYESEESCREHYPEDFRGDPREMPHGPWNADLRALPTYINDSDETYDSTYANFYFNIPDEFKGLLTQLVEMKAGNMEKPAERWKQVLEDLDTGAQTDAAKRAREVGKRIMDQLNSTPNGDIIEV